MILLKAFIITVLVFAIPLALLALFIKFPVVGIVVACVFAFLVVFANVLGAIL